MSATSASVAGRERVEIKYTSRVGGVERDVELPFKILILGDFTRREEEDIFEERPPLPIDRTNFDQVMADLNLTLDLEVDDHLSDGPPGKLWLKPAFRRLADFDPPGVAEGAPPIRRLLEKRTFLLQLRRPLATGSLAAELRSAAGRADWTGDPGQDETAMLGDLLARTGIEVPDDPSAARGALTALLAALAADPAATPSPRLIDRLTADLDDRIGRQLDAVLHHPEFQALERVWRGLWFLVRNTDFQENIRLEIISISKAELIDDFLESFEVTKSGLHYHLYTSEYGQFGGTPFGAVVAAYDFGPGPEDVRLMTDLAAVGVMAHAPIIGGAAPRMFGDDRYLSLPHLEDVAAHFDSPVMARWRSLRENEDARVIGLVLPRFLLRPPHTAEDGVFRGFAYEEDVRQDHDHYLWGHPAFAFASRLTDSFARFRWCPNIIGPEDGRVEGLVHPEFEAWERIESRMPVEVMISEQKEHQLAEQGFIALTMRHGADQPRFYSANSAQRPKYYGRTAEGRQAFFNYRLGVQLPYYFILCRVAHYLKVLQREQIGTWKERSDLESQLNKWLRQYVSDMDDPSPGVRRRRPLRQARVEVAEVEANPGIYRVDIKLRPHFKYMGALFDLSLVGRMDKE
jgi:type VI secretion system protein ImpC